MPLLWQWKQRLGKELDARSSHRELAGFRAHERSSDADEIAHIQKAHDLPIGFTKGIFSHVDLKFLPTLADIQEGRLATVPVGHDAAHDRHRTRIFLQRGSIETSVDLDDIADAVAPLGLARPHVQAQGLQLSELFEANLTVLIGVHGVSRPESISLARGTDGLETWD